MIQERCFEKPSDLMMPPGSVCFFTDNPPNLAINGAYTAGELRSTYNGELNWSCCTLVAWLTIS